LVLPSQTLRNVPHRVPHSKIKEQKTNKDLLIVSCMSNMPANVQHQSGFRRTENRGASKKTEFEALNLNYTIQIENIFRIDFKILLVFSSCILLPCDISYIQYYSSASNHG